MKEGLWEIDLSELARIYSKYKEYIGDIYIPGEYTPGDKVWCGPITRLVMWR